MGEDTSDLIPLSEREKLLIKIAAEESARIVLMKLPDEFYKQFGKTVFQRVFIILGAVLLTLAYTKGWIKFGG